MPKNAHVFQANETTGAMLSVTVWPPHAHLHHVTVMTNMSSHAAAALKCMRCTIKRHGPWCVPVFFFSSLFVYSFVFRPSWSSERSCRVYSDVRYHQILTVLHLFRLFSDGFRCEAPESLNFQLSQNGNKNAGVYTKALVVSLS